MEFLQLILTGSLIDHPIYTFIFIIILFRWADLKDMLSATDKAGDKSLSSRRFTAVVSLWGLIHISVYYAEHKDTANPAVLWPLMLLCILCLGLTTWEGIMMGLDKVKNLMTLKETKSQTPVTELSGSAAPNPE